MFFFFEDASNFAGGFLRFNELDGRIQIVKCQPGRLPPQPGHQMGPPQPGSHPAGGCAAMPPQGGQPQPGSHPADGSMPPQGWQPQPGSHPAGCAAMPPQQGQMGPPQPGSHPAGGSMPPQGWQPQPGSHPAGCTAMPPQQGQMGPPQPGSHPAGGSMPPQGWQPQPGSHPAGGSMPPQGWQPQPGAMPPQQGQMGPPQPGSHPAGGSMPPQGWQPQPGSHPAGCAAMPPQQGQMGPQPGSHPAGGSMPPQGWQPQPGSHPAGCAAMTPQQGQMGPPQPGSHPAGGCASMPSQPASHAWANYTGVAGLDSDNDVQPDLEPENLPCERVWFQKLGPLSFPTNPLGDWSVYRHLSSKKEFKALMTPRAILIDDFLFAKAGISATCNICAAARGYREHLGGPGHYSTLSKSYVKCGISVESVRLGLYNKWQIPGGWLRINEMDGAIDLAKGLTEPSDPRAHLLQNSPPEPSQMPQPRPPEPQERQSGASFNATGSPSQPPAGWGSVPERSASGPSQPPGGWGSVPEGSASRPSQPPAGWGSVPEGSASGPSQPPGGRGSVPEDREIDECSEFSFCDRGVPTTSGGVQADDIERPTTTMPRSFQPGDFSGSSRPRRAPRWASVPEGRETDESSEFSFAGRDVHGFPVAGTGGPEDSDERIDHKKIVEVCWKKLWNEKGDVSESAKTIQTKFEQFGIQTAS